MSEFESTTLLFDSSNLDTSKIQLPSTNTENKFGLLTLKSVPSLLTDKNLEIIFQVDCSGSMSDKCSDGRTKMHHILHTLKNMILYFKENPALKVYITIHSFDDTIYNIVDRTNVTKDTYDQIIASIDTITPRNSTNIEKALNDTKEQLAKLKKEFPDNIYHQIFLTDGQTNAGAISHDTLHECVDDSITNAFIGFGMDHDAALLNAISTDEKSAYYFIDKLENAGLVYGEILHGFVYKLLEDVDVTIKNGFIYNFKTNAWVKTLRIGDTIGESVKFYHIVSDTPTECTCQITGKKSTDGSNIVIDIHPQTDTDTNTNLDLTKYIYRHQTQHLLYRINEFLQSERMNNNNDFIDICQFKDNKNIEQTKILRETLRELFEELKKYMLDNGLQDDIMLKNVCDDVYICYRTFGTNLAEMYCGARMCSQGAQRAYTATHIPENYIEENELFHEVSGSIDTPYRSTTITQMMDYINTTPNTL